MIRFKLLETPLIRNITRIQSNGFYLSQDNGKDSYLEFPKASLFEADEKGFKIFEAGLRELTEQEQAVKDNEPKDEKQEKIDMMSDGSTMFFRRKKYFSEKGFNYLFGNNKQEGKRLTFKEGNPIIQDESIKGKLILEYKNV